MGDKIADNRKKPKEKRFLGHKEGLCYNLPLKNHNERDRELYQE
jgi:hypothetical protein